MHSRSLTAINGDPQRGRKGDASKVEMGYSARGEEMRTQGAPTEAPRRGQRPRRMSMDRGSRREGRGCIRTRRRRSTTIHEEVKVGFGLVVVGAMMKRGLVLGCAWILRGEKEEKNKKRRR